MKAFDTMEARGSVAPYLIDLKTGRRTPFGRRHNTLSFSAADAMAAAFGGDSTRIPNRIGIVYGSDTDSPAFSGAGIDRSQSWDILKGELAEAGANVQIRPFSSSPTLSVVCGRESGESSGSTSSASGSDPAYDGWGHEDGKDYWGLGTSSDCPYLGNAVTFHMHSDSVTPGAFGGESSSSAPIFSAGNRIFQAVLLNVRPVGDPTILARVSLDDAGTYRSKPENFEIALDWTVRFF